ncbi:MAG: gluconate 2-dehydrogenase subunit 3 family protein [Bryobacteraceae bacterium]
MAERREALKILGSVGATCAYPFAADELYGQTEQHVHAAGAAAALPKPSHFSAADFATVTRLADLIIPKTGTPGAVDAGVPAYIDFVVKQNKQAQSLFRRGLAWLDAAAQKHGAKRFVDLDEPAQIAILQPLSDAAASAKPPMEVAFFRSVKGLTADGYYTSETGLMRELGYKGNTVLGGFPVCTHNHGG